VSAAGQPLAEIPEAAATGRTAELYADIRAVSGLPMVNLVYRHLATTPELLERCWAGLGPNLASANAAAAAAELVALAATPGAAALPPATLAAAGLAGEQAGLARATLAAYARGNSLNVLAMFALLDGCYGGTDAAGAEQPAPARVLPMAPLDALTPAAAALLDEMSLGVVGGEEPRLVPSLFRHFAGDERQLALVWSVVEPALGAALERAARVADRARALAAGLPHPVPALRDEAGREVARRFSVATSRMLVVGELLAAALAEAE
jgi:hypothetical protein